MANEKEQKEIKIMISERIQSAVFSNVARISSTEREVIIDFAFLPPDSNEGFMVSRIALTLEHAKALQETLENHLQRRHGERKDKK